jgi:soluble lytic murein transglycosylase-like protein
VNKRTFWITAIVLVLGGACFRSFVNRPDVAHAITVGALAEVDREAGLTPPAARQPPAQPPASPTLPPYVPAAATKIYIYLDADGTRHYTNVPNNNRDKVLVSSPQDMTENGQHYDPTLMARVVQYDTIIEKAAATASVDSNLLRAVIVVGSGFNSHAVSKDGAVGLMQLTPATAMRFGVSDPYDPKQNVHAGARYLKYLIDRFGQDIRLALAAYNAGEEAVDRFGGRIPPFPETMDYVPRVLKIYRILNAQRPTQELQSFTGPGNNQQQVNANVPR